MDTYLFEMRVPEDVVKPIAKLLGVKIPKDKSLTKKSEELIQEGILRLAKLSAEAILGHEAKNKEKS